ncbi:MAG: CarD family transcriptional regulator [Gordonibacter sp.]
MFSPGDIVVYHHHVCEVVSIREGYFEGKDYFELHALFENSLKLFVAIDDAAPPALRPTMTRKEALSLIDSIADAESIDVDALRPGANTPVLLDRHIREEYDRHLKTLAEGLLCDELSISLDMERDSVKDFLAQCVEKSETRR